MSEPLIKQIMSEPLIKLIFVIVMIINFRLLKNQINHFITKIKGSDNSNLKRNWI